MGTSRICVKIYTHEIRSAHVLLQIKKLYAWGMFAPSVHIIDQQSFPTNK